MSNDLFRKEAIEHRRQKLWGDVIIVRPLSDFILVGLLAGIVLVALAVLSFGTYARTEEAPGFLVPDRGLAKIFALQNGVISNIMAREGDKVQAGTVLATIKVEQATADGSSTEAQALLLINQQISTLEERLISEHKRANTERRRLESELTSLGRQVQELQAEKTVQNAITASAEKSFQDLAEVVEKGYVSRSEYERRRQAFLQHRQSERQLEQRLVALERDRDTTRSLLERLPADIADKVATLDNEISELRQRYAEIEGRQSYSITAPITGRVSALQVSVGEISDPKVPLMTLLPEGGALEADLYVPSRAVGFVKEGQEVRLLYDAFPYQRFGTFMGTVKTVTRTIIAPQEAATPFVLEEPAYRVKVYLREQDVLAFGEAVPLQPGMTLKARIVLERQSLLSWLLEPLRAIRTGA